MKNTTLATLRFYDTSLSTSLDEAYKAAAEGYESKNHFFTELIRLGLVEKQKENMIKRDWSACRTADESTKALVLNAIEDLHIASKKQAQEILAHLAVIEKLVASAYTILVSIIEDESISTSQLEAGFYDDLPERFSNGLKEMLAQVLKENR